MIRYPSMLIIFMTILIATSLYQIKYLITKKEIELSKIENQITKTKSDLYILKAELTYLKRPDRLEKIAKNKLNMREILPIDIWNLKDLVNVTNSLNKNR